MSAHNLTKATELAKEFHDVYEALAPQFGYETREESAKPWADVPEKNKRLMVAVCDRILAEQHARKILNPELGYATISQLLEELKARAEMGGYDDYRPVATDCNAPRRQADEHSCQLWLATLKYPFQGQLAKCPVCHKLWVNAVDYLKGYHARWVEQK